MKRLLRRRPSPALVIACVALLVALGPAAYASHLGSLLVGHTNAAGGAQTSLTGSRAGKVLQVTNNNTGGGATALGLTVASGKPPLTVNSGTKVANLNADRVDGLDSTGFVQGKGTVYKTRYFTADPFDHSTLLTIPGLASVHVLNCSLSQPWANTQLNILRPVSVWRDIGSGNPQYFDAEVIPSSSSSELGSKNLTVFHLSRGLVASTQSATIEIWTQADSSKCGFSVTAIVYG